MVASIMNEPGLQAVTMGKPAKMIVIADGDIIRNEVSWSGGSPEPLALGLDRYTMQTFGNKDFLVNCINYLVNDNGLIEIRRVICQMINTVMPVINIIHAGVAYNLFRRRRFISVK
jgi:ABC-2 type transport system permease protein